MEQQIGTPSHVTSAIEDAEEVFLLDSLESIYADWEKTEEGETDQYLADQLAKALRVLAVVMMSVAEGPCVLCERHKRTVARAIRAVAENRLWGTWELDLIPIIDFIESHRERHAA